MPKKKLPVMGDEVLIAVAWDGRTPESWVPGIVLEVGPAPHGRWEFVFLAVSDEEGDGLRLAVRTTAGGMLHPLSESGELGAVDVPERLAGLRSRLRALAEAEDWRAGFPSLRPYATVLAWMREQIDADCVV